MTEKSVPSGFSKTPVGTGSRSGNQSATQDHRPHGINDLPSGEVVGNHGFWGANSWKARNSIFQLRPWLVDSTAGQECGSIEVHRGLQPFLDFTHGLRRQSA